MFVRGGMLVVGLTWSVGNWLQFNFGGHPQINNNNNFIPGKLRKALI